MSDDTMVPNWMRILLLLLSGASFVPQLGRLYSRGDSSGISRYYVLCNLISATEQLTLALALLVNTDDGGSDFFLHSPLTLGDRLNMAQLATVWLLSLVVFLLCLYYPSDHRDASSDNKQVTALYTSFLLVSLLPALALLWSPPTEDREDRRWLPALFHGVHSLWISPLATLLGLAAAFFQIRETTRADQDQQALSLVGLVVQGAVFACVAASWAVRVVFPWSEVPGSDGDARRLGPGFFWSWYQLVGWAAVDNAVFALAQVVVWCVALRRFGNMGGPKDGESEPLIR